MNLSQVSFRISWLSPSTERRTSSSIWSSCTRFFPPSPPPTSASLPPLLSGQLHPIFVIPLESREESLIPDELGQGLKHCHKSAAHFNATLKQCERLVSVAPALFLYGLLWLFFLKRPCGVILKFLSVCWQLYGPFCRVQELRQACETSDIKIGGKCQAEGTGWCSRDLEVKD